MGRHARTLVYLAALAAIAGACGSGAAEPGRGTGTTAPEPPSVVWRGEQGGEAAEPRATKKLSPLQNFFRLC